MTRWGQASEIQGLADQLGVAGAAPVEGILNHCRRRIDGWVAGSGGVANIEALESLVTQRLQMVFEEIKTDDDWDRLKEVYARGKKEFVFGGIRSKFDDDDNLTYGALVERRHAEGHDPDRYVAVIDCRGSKLVAILIKFLIYSSSPRLASSSSKKFFVTTPAPTCTTEQLRRQL